jgi:hypothetical protein
MKRLIKDKKFTIIFSIIILLHIFLLTRLIFFPYPELFIYSYLTDKGLIPYKQIFDQHFPGLMFLPVNLFSLGITTIYKMRFVHLGITILTDLVFLMISGKFFKKRIWVILTLIIYVFWQIYLEGHVLWIETFITPLLLISFLMMLKFEEKRNTIDLYASAFALGISVVFKQTVIPLIFLLFIYLFIKRIGLRKILMTLLIVFIPIMFVLIHFFKIQAINDFFYWTVTFNLTTFSQMGKTYPTFTNIIKITPIFGVAVLSAIILYIKRERRYLFLTGLYFIGALFFVYARFDLIHLQPALPFSILIFVLFLRYIGAKISFPLILVYFVISLYIFIPNFKFYSKPGLSPMFNDPITLELLRVISKYEVSGGKIFAFGAYPQIYYLTGTLPPGDVFTFQFPWFMKVTERKVLTAVTNDRPMIVLRDYNAEVGDYNLIEYMPNINNFIERNYKAVDKVGSIEILLKI